MANRKITQFPAILPGDIVDQDLITAVSVFEVDPALRNKKLNFSGLRVYLDQYYINVGETDPFIVGNVVVSGYAIISGNLVAESEFIVSGQADFKDDVIFRQDITVGGGITVTGNIAANQIDVLNVNTQYLEAVSGNFTIATGTTLDFVSGYFDYVSGTTITGDNVGIESGTVVDLTVTRGIDAVSGYFDYLIVDEFVGSGVTITGDIDANNINATGVISGSTITGDIVNIQDLTVVSGDFTYLSGTTITGDTVLFTTATGQELTVTSGWFTNLSGATITGELIKATSGIFESFTVTDDLTISGDLFVNDITANFISGVSGEFQTLSGNEISGDTINATLINVLTLNATELAFSGDQEISGNLNVLSGLTVSGNSAFGSGLDVSGTFSGTLITGQSGVFDDLVTAPLVSGTSAVFSGLLVTGEINANEIYVSNNLTVTGNTNLSGDLIVDGTAEISGDTSISGNLSITSGDIVGDGSTTITGIDYLVATSGYFEADLIVSGVMSMDDAFFVSGLGVGNSEADPDIRLEPDAQVELKSSTSGTGVLIDIIQQTGNDKPSVITFDSVDSPAGRNKITYITTSGSTDREDAYLRFQTDNGVSDNGKLDIGGAGFIDITSAINKPSFLAKPLTSQNWNTASGRTAFRATNYSVATFNVDTMGDATVRRRLTVGNQGLGGERIGGLFQGISPTDAGNVSTVTGVELVYGTDVNFTVQYNGDVTSSGTISGVTVTAVTGTFNTAVIENEIDINSDLNVSGDAYIGGGVTISGDLVVSGITTLTSGVDVPSGQAAFQWGTVGAPGITFTGDLNTGFYNPSGEMITAAVNGKAGWTIESGTGDSAGRHVLTIWGD